MQCHNRDGILEGDIDNGWEKPDIDELPDQGPFIGTPGLNLDTESRKPEDFFNYFFDDRMFTIIADATNDYTHKKIRSLLKDRDAFQQLEHHSHKRHARLSTWKDMNASDIKILIAHLLVMCSVKKPALHNYWSTTSLSRTPFFGQYFSRNHFQDILWNLHVCDTSDNPAPSQPNHDPLAKVHPFIVMCQDKFKLQYTPNENLAVDESCVPFKGLVKFLQYNKVSIILQMPILIA